MGLLQTLVLEEAAEYIASLAAQGIPAQYFESLLEGAGYYKSLAQAAEIGGQTVYTDSVILTQLASETGGAATTGSTAVTTIGYATEATEAGGIVTVGTELASTTIGGEVAANYAVVGGLTAAQLLASVAVGAGIGVAAYNLEPEFWTDFSNALIERRGDEVVSCLIRHAQNPMGEYAMYVDEDAINAALDYLYDQHMFDPRNEIVDYTTAGTHEFTYEELDVEQLIRLYAEYAALDSSLPNLSPEQLQMMWDEAVETTRRFGYNLVNIFMQRYSASETTLRIDFANYKEETIDTVYYGGWDLQTVDLEVTGGLRFTIRNTDGAILETELRTGTQRFAAGSHIYSHSALSGNLGVHYTGNKNSIPNPDSTTELDPSLFWTTFAPWAAKAWVQHVFDPATQMIGDTKWLPLGLETPDLKPNDATYGDQDNAQDGQVPDPDINPDPTDLVLKTPFFDFEPYIPTPPDINIPNKPNLPTGINDTPDSPPVGAVGGSSDALYSVYHPTKAQINALGSYLWTSNIIDIIQQFFQNPMDAIISLHLVYCTPVDAAAKNIKLGYLDSGVSSATVANQYVKIDCGSVTVPEYYGNVNDYDNTDCEIYLPFIGIRGLKTTDVVGATINVTYIIDLYTGACVANLQFIRGNIKQVLYTFEGNCSVQVPLTGADRSRIVSSTIGLGLSAATGNVVGAVSSAASAGVSIQRTSNFSGNAGAMSIKTPYLIICRKKAADAYNYNAIYGYPANSNVNLGTLRGFTKVKDVILDTIPCTDQEKQIIKGYLTSGVIL